MIEVGRKYRHILNGDIVEVIELFKSRVCYEKIKPTILSGVVLSQFTKPYRIFEQFYKAV